MMRAVGMVRLCLADLSEAGEPVFLWDSSGPG